MLCGIDDNEFWVENLYCNQGVGSGFKFAISAMDHGKSAKDAVKYAATRDIYTGGKIHVYDIASARFIK
jgi:ATP-dependent protease HslVU (ClpYQ) peptidase subunit